MCMQAQMQRCMKSKCRLIMLWSPRHDHPTFAFHTHTSFRHSCIYACICCILYIHTPCRLPAPPTLLLRYRCPIPGLAEPPQIWARGLIWSPESWGLSAAPWSAPLLLRCSLAWTCQSSHSPASKIKECSGLFMAETPPQCRNATLLSPDVSEFRFWV